MDSRELYPSDEQRRRIMDFIMAAGETLLENGAEVFRVEQTMEIMARSFHLREFHVYVLTNGIFASAGTAEIAEVRNVPVRTTHLGRVVAVNALSREIAAGGVTLDEAEHRLAEARRIPFPKGKTQLLALGTVEPGKLFNDPVLHMDAVDLVLHEDGVALADHRHDTGPVSYTHLRAHET